MQLGEATAMACFSSRHASFNPTKQKWLYKRRNQNHKRCNKKHKPLRKTKEKGNRVTTNGPTKNRVSWVICGPKSTTVQKAKTLGQHGKRYVKRSRTKKPVEKCQRKIKELIDKYKDAKTWNKTQSGGQLRKSVFYDKIDRVLGTRDVVTLKHVVEAGMRTDSPIPNLTSPSTDDSVAPGSSSGTPSPQPSTRGTSGTSSGESSNAVNRPSRARKERKRATKRKIPEDGKDKEATLLKRSIESIEKQGKKLTEIMQGLQENQSKQLEMVASFMGSLVEAIKEKNWQLWSVTIYWKKN